MSASDAPQDVHAYDAFVVAASVHAGGYQRDLKWWVRVHAQTLAEKPSVFVSVCLGVLQKDPEVREDLRSDPREVLP